MESLNWLTRFLRRVKTPRQRLHWKQPLKSKPLTWETLESREMLSGVTLITHGHTDNAAGGWIREMGQDMMDRAVTTLPGGDAYTEIEIFVTTASDGLSLTVDTAQVLSTSTTPLSSLDHSGEVVVYLDWNGAQSLTSAFDPYNTEYVSQAVLPYLTGEQTITGLDTPLAAQSFHLLGHSRGGSLVGALANDLGEEGIIVDHVTYFDPHPLLPGDYNVWESTVPQTVVYADSVWRTDGLIGLEEFWDFDGEHISGSFNNQLSEGLLNGAGTFIDPGYAFEHSDVTLWYQGTVPLSDTPVPSDGYYDVPLDWYGGDYPLRTESGYAASRIAGGDRPSEGLLDTSDWTLNRGSVDLTDALWPNVFNVTQTSSTQLGTGDPITIAFDYLDVDSAINVSFFLDSDQNPFNGNALAESTLSFAETGTNLAQTTATIDTAFAPAGRYYIQSRASDASGRARYSYANQSVDLFITNDSISGVNWWDLDGDAIQDTDEPGLSGWTVYIDANNDGNLNAGETSTVTNAEGSYVFSGLDAGKYVIGEVMLPGWEQTFPDSIPPTSSSSFLNTTLYRNSAPSQDGAADKLTLDDNSLLAADYVHGEVIVKLKDSATRGSLSDLRVRQAFDNVTIQKTSRYSGHELWSINTSVEDALAQWGNDPRIEYIQPNYSISINATIPNDPSFTQLWGLNNTGQGGGTADADIDAAEAWDIQTGSDSVLIGVIDTGIDYTHPDLVDNIWTNPGEIAGNGIDDDNNGYIDDIHGYDFADDDGDPMDGDSHGTHVAGTIAANGNDGTGVVGVNWDAQLMALRFLDNNGNGSTYDALLAIEYATMMGAKITNNSWGGGGYDQAMYDAIAAAGNAGSLFVAAAGNSSSNNDTSLSYPASYDLDNIISVASTDRNDALSWFSNFGATTVDLAAPGSAIYSTVPNGGYSSFDGTSMASPHVAGVAGLILAQDPSLTPVEIKQIILDSVDPVSVLSGITLTGGRLNAFGALALTRTPGTHVVNVDLSQPITDIDFGNRLYNASPSFDAIDAVALAWNTASHQLTMTGISAGTNESQQLRITATSNNTSLIPDPIIDYLSPGSTATLMFYPTIDQSGTATITVTLTDAGIDGEFATQYDNKEITQTFTISVYGPILIDNGGSGFTKTYHWYDDGPVGYGSNPAHWIWTQTLESNRAEAVWQADVTGQFQVAATWVGDTTYDPNATYEVWDADTLLGTVNVNQTQDPTPDSVIDGTPFEKLGDSWLVNTGPLRIILSNVSTDYGLRVMADAIRIIPDTESLSLSLNDDSISESNGMTTATVTRTDTSGDLTVTLTSDDVSEATVPATVTILDGASNATFDIAAVDDSEVDGTQSVTVSASASGYISGTAILSVSDDDHEVFIGILDDGDAGFTQTGFTPMSNSQVAAAYGADNHNMRGGTGSASWTFTGLADGEYQVAATWFHKYDNAYNTLDAPFGIENSGGSVLASTTVNQKNAPSEFTYGGYSWDTLGTVNVTDGSLIVTLGAGTNSNQVTVADAIRIERIGNVTPTLTLSLADASVSEAAGGAATTATVTRTDTSGDLTVTLTSDDVSEATVPATVTILDGASSATFDIAAVDDSDADGTQTVTVSAAATGYIAGSDALEVTDDEASLVAILDDGDAGFTQTGFTPMSNSQVAAAYGADNHNMRGGTGSASWTFTGLADGEYQVAATWFHKYDNAYNTLDAPFGIENSGGSVLASTTVNQKNAPSEFTYGGYSWDTLGTVNVTDGSLIVTLGAGTNSNQVTVADAIRIEQTGSITPTLTLSINDASVSEAAGGAATTATVTRTDTSGDLTVTLTSDDVSEATVPATVTILDGASSATFDIAAVDDSDADGTQTVTVSAAATGYIAGSDALEVTDDEASLVAILDDGDAGFTQTGFTPMSNSQVAAAYGADNHNMRGGTGSASWTFTGLADGEYQVAATWFHKYDNAYNTLDAPFGIENSGGSVLASTTVNQKNAPSEFTYGGYSWDTLGTVNVTDGSLIVTLGAGTNSNQVTVADAIRIEQTGSITPTLTLSINDASVSEAAGGAATTATVTRTYTSGDLTVTLTSDDVSEATVPATVTILDGASSATFDIAAVDDSDADGTQTVTVSAAATGYIAGSDALEVTDDEASLVAILDDGDAGFTQTGFTPMSNSQVAAAYGADNHNMRGGTGSASWTFTGLADGEYQVAATWFHKYDNAYNTLDAPFGIENSGGSVLASTTVNQKNSPSEFTYGGYSWDTLGTVNVTDGSLIVTLEAGTNSNKVTVADAIRIERIGNVTPTLTLSLADASVSEAAGGAATTATVTRTDTSGDLTVTLTSDDVSEATVPATVTILDGASSATFDIAAVDDSDADGTQTVTVSATATGYIAGSDALEVTDDEASLVAILDDGDAGFTQTGFTPMSNSQVAAAYGADNHNMRGGTGSASWTFTGLADGEYQVAATWFHKYDNAYNTLDAPFGIENSGGSVLASTTVNQKNAPSEFTYGGYSWDTLGTVNVTDGSLIVTLGAGTNSNQVTVADAIRIERLSTNGSSLIADDNLEDAHSTADAAVADLLFSGKY